MPAGVYRFWIISPGSKRMDIAFSSIASDLRIILDIDDHTDYTEKLGLEKTSITIRSTPAQKKGAVEHCTLLPDLSV